MQPLRRILQVLLPVIVVGLLAPSASLAQGSYNNANIATKALTYVNQWGGNACNDAQKPGDTGGQCRAFVNCIVWMVSGHSQNVGTGWPDYFAGFLNAAGQEITNTSQLSAGDIVQVGQTEPNVHTVIIVKKKWMNSDGTGTFNVVDSNSDGNNDEIVRNYDRTFSLSSTTRAFRMGTHYCGPAGDIDCDGSVGITDLSMLLSSYGNRSRACLTASQFICDVNGNGVVDVFDLSILLSNYGK